ncbi:hypothetical protein O6H91_06G144200 [Diphasiastrum complanatum]|uniref:Uncharacterized protein n=2 Tax=Diphasiastrum complanatum TaxID=34168 RepID=A0ACC2DJY6_DIPCM|nr:hypothetical protein O6H91_06G144200 [Diphasiastrum complanatum]
MREPRSITAFQLGNACSSSSSAAAAGLACQSGRDLGTPDLDARVCDVKRSWIALDSGLENALEPLAGALVSAWTNGCRHIEDGVQGLGSKRSQATVSLGQQSTTYSARTSFRPLWRRWVRSPSSSLTCMDRRRDVRRLCLASISSATTVASAKPLESTLVVQPSIGLLLKHPVALLNYVPKDLALFLAGALAGAAAKTVTAPLDRVKLLMQVHGVNAAREGVKKSANFLEAIMKIGKEEGIMGYWKGNLPQVIRVIPYSAVQLFAYEFYKKLFRKNGTELSVSGRLAAGACAGMTSTLVTYPLDTLRLRMAVDPASKGLYQVLHTMLQEEGLGSLYRGLGPSLLGIAPYIAVNFCVFDLVKKSIPEEARKKPEASFLTALLSATLATTMCYPLDTVRRQMQMKSTTFKSVWEAIPGIVARDGLVGLYRGFVPNALKNLPSSSIRLTTFDAAKNILNAGQLEFQRLSKLQQEQLSNNSTKQPVS